MIKKTVIALGAALAFASFSGTARADAVEDAFRLCAVFDGSGMASEPCEVSGWGSSVDVRIDTSSSEARKLCDQIASMVYDKGLRFNNKWTLKIRSPYSGDNTIAYCTLR